jgi:hypothetical protein
MPAGMTTTGSLSDSLQFIVDGARMVREYPPVMVKLSDRQKLKEGEGLTWDEISVSQIDAQDIQETTELDNPQQLVDTLFSLTPTVSGVQTRITDRAKRRVAKKTLAQTGGLMQNAIERKKDKDGLTVLDASAISRGGAGTTLTHGHVAAAVATVKHGNLQEASKSPIYTVLHSNQRYAIQQEILAGVGTYTIPTGLSESVFRSGFSGSIAGSELYIDDNIEIDGLGDAKGGVFAREGLVYVQGHDVRGEEMRRPQTGGGATDMFLYDEYIFGERLAGNTGGWIVEMYFDATTPTS